MNRPNLPPELVQQIQKNLAEGRDLPPGVVAVPGGQAPPPGAVPTGITAPMMPGAAHPPITPQAQRAMSRAQENPLPEGDAGLQVLRGLSDCPIPAESGKLQGMMKTLLASEDIDNEAVEKTLVKGIVTSLRANRYCRQQKRTRTVCIFEQDPKLQKLHELIQQKTKEMDELNKQMQECLEAGQKALQDRWNYAVKTYGLAPEKFSYFINEDDGTIELVELKCAECKGATSIRKARQETTELVMRMEPAGGKKNDRPRKEPEGDGTPEGDAANSREASDGEQEVQSVADSADSDGGNGSDSSDNAT